MDIGGTRARIYEYKVGQRLDRLEIELPLIDPSLSTAENSNRRIKAISRLVSYFASKRDVPRIATACAGKKDTDRTGVTLLNFAVPLPNLTGEVSRETGTEIGPLFDDDVAAAWGHLASSDSPLANDGKNTMLLTSGTGLAEAHFVDGKFLDKKTYPRASEFGLEVKLRAEGWRASGNPSEAICELVEQRREIYSMERLILAGRFVHMDRDCLSYLERTLSLEVHLVELSEAPALGALQLLQASAS